MIDEKETSKNVEMVASRIEEIARSRVRAIIDSNPVAMLFDAKLDDVIEKIIKAKKDLSLPGDYSFFKALEKEHIIFDMSQAISRISEQIAIDMLKDLEQRRNSIDSPGHDGQ